MPADAPTPAEPAETCGAWPPALDGHNYPCTETGPHGEHRHGTLRWTTSLPPQTSADTTPADVYLAAARAWAHVATPLVLPGQNEVALGIADEPCFRAAVDAARAPLLAENARLRVNVTSERLTCDISRDLRARGPWPSERLLTEAADKLDGLLTSLAHAETDRDRARASLAGAVAANDALAAADAEARAEVDRLRAAHPQPDPWSNS